MEIKRILFAEASDGEIKKLVDNSAQRNTKKNPQNMQKRCKFVRLEKLFGGL